MNLTLHLVRKDLRVLRWGLLLWLCACATHLLLRLAQHFRGEGALLNQFWSGIETTDRWDYFLVVGVPILLIPLLIHMDPLRGVLSFWKAVPIGRSRLLAAKLGTVAVLFILLPLACETIYFVATGLGSVLPRALGDWAWRYLPGVAATVAGSLAVRSLRMAVPLIVVALVAAEMLLGWPLGKKLAGRNALPGASRTASETTGLPQSVRVELEPNSIHFNRTRFTYNDYAGKGERPPERTSIGVTVHVNGLPEGLLVHSVKVDATKVHLRERVIGSTGNPAFLPSPPSLPAAEQRDGLPRRDFNGLKANDWSGKTEYLPFSTPDLNPNGTLVEGRVLVRLIQKKQIATLPLKEGATWQAGLHQFALWSVSPPDSGDIRFRSALTTILADPRGLSGGLSLLPTTEIAVWLEHQTLPMRKYLHSIPAEAWQPTGYTGRGSNGVDLSGAYVRTGSLIDLTRSRKRLEMACNFDPTKALQNDATPLTLARLEEEQVRNWKLVLVSYDDAGTVEIPLRGIVPSPPPARNEEGLVERKSPLPPLRDLIAKVALPENPGAADATRALAELADLTAARNESDIRGASQQLYLKLLALSPGNVETLLQSARAASPAFVYGEVSPRGRPTWLRTRSRPGLFWRHVLTVACDTARVEDKAAILAHHSPEMDLLRAIEPNGWLAEAVPRMCAFAAKEPVPQTWIDAIADAREPGCAVALLAQVQQRCVPLHRVAQLIDSGVLPGHETASTVWETVIANTGNPKELPPAFALAVKHGVEIAPRDLLRTLRMKSEGVNLLGNFSLKQLQNSLLQLFSLRSDCPAALVPAIGWLEQNARLLEFNEGSGRYELPGARAEIHDTSGWGRLEDPLGLATARLANGALIFTTGGASPGGVHELPRLVREVEGDFTAEVTVEPEFAWSGNESSLFQAAGLLVLANEQRWIRWEHALFRNESGHQLREETMRAGKNTVVQRATDSWDPSKPVRLRVSRDRDLFTTAWSQENGAWVESPAELNLGWPRKVLVGVGCVNHATRLLTARFTDLKVMPGGTLPADAAVTVASHPAGQATPTGASLGAWGVVENPIGAGVFTVDGETLSISVAPRVADYHIQQQLTAPRALTEVEGDFTVEATIAPTVKLQWNSAELLVAGGSDFYLRVGLASNNGNKPQFAYNYAEEGRPASIPSLDAPRELTKPFQVRLQRRGWLLTISHRQEGGDWTEFYPLNLSKWPGRLKVGVVALNTSNEVFPAQFSGWKLEKH